LDKLHAASLEQVQELLQLELALTRRQGDAHGPPQVLVAPVVVGWDRLLHPEQAEFFHRPDPDHRLPHRPALVGVYHQKKVWPNGLPHRPEPFYILLQARSPHFDLHTPIALAGVARNLIQELLN
jgi:hypothetical protein